MLRAAEWTESLRDMVTSVFETNLSLQDARLNTVMKKLTVWAAIIAVPTAVTGFFGQNVPYPGFGHHAGFLASVVVIAVLAGAALAGLPAQGLAVAAQPIGLLDSVVNRSCVQRQRHRVLRHPAVVHRHLRHEERAVRARPARSTG